MRCLAAAICAVFFFAVVGFASPANAAPCPNGSPIDLLNTLCVTPNGIVQVQGPDGNVVTSVTVPTQAPITIAVPGPTRTVTATPPAPRTVTRTVTAAPTTVTATVTTPPTTVTETITTRQTRSSSATVSRTPASLATPPPTGPVDSGSKVDIIPDTPASALAEGTLIGIILGVLAGLLVAYLRGKKVGEKETLRESLDILRGEGPKTGRHRVE